MKMAYNLDKTDLKILKILQEDGRITNLQLSTEIGLSPAPTLERVKKLEKSGIIKSYHATLDPSTLGLGIQTLMLVTLSRHVENAIKNFISAVKSIDEVVECYHLTGSSDYLLKIMVKDIAAYENLASNRIASIEGIGHLQSMVILSTIKSAKRLPLKYESEVKSNEPEMAV